jgi:ABC-type uncharacterized transport system substrate-binding protein
MAYSTDPVDSGFVANLARPGGSVTGLSSISPDLSGKRLEILREVVPGLTRVAILWNPDVRSARLEYKETEAGARALGLELQSVEIFSVGDLARAFSALSSQRAQAFVVSPGPPAGAQRAAIAELGLRNRLPSMYPTREFVDLGGLMSYGPSTLEMFRRTATYVDKILKGAKPCDLPVERPSKFELAINLTAAKALRLEIPQSVLSRADQAALAPEAQPGKVPKIGVLLVADLDFVQPLSRQGLRGVGLVEGQNIQVEYRSAEGRVDRLDALAMELVRLKVNVIVAQATSGILAAKRATTVIHHHDLGW